MRTNKNGAIETLYTVVRDLLWEGEKQTNKKVLVFLEDDKECEHVYKQMTTGQNNHIVSFKEEVIMINAADR